MIPIWLEIGISHGIKRAIDPPFDETMFYKCKTIDELEGMLGNIGNWVLGQAFYWENLCFINLNAGGDEWLAIRDNKKFDCVGFDELIMDGKFESYIKRVSRSSDNVKQLEFPF